MKSACLQEYNLYLQEMKSETDHVKHFARVHL